MRRPIYPGDPSSAGTFGAKPKGSHMADRITLTVPGKYAEDFRAASAHELGDEGRSVLQYRAEVEEARRWSENRDKPRTAELDLALRMLAVDATICQQAAGAEGEDITVDVDDPYGCVAQVVETVARNIVGPEFKSALGVGPIDRDWAARLHEQIAEMTWAIDTAAALHDERFPSEPREEGAVAR